MKAVLLYIGFILFFYSCNDNKGKSDVTPVPAHSEHAHEPGGQSIELNNGKKWKSDAVTDANIASLNQQVEQARQITAEDVNAYIEAGAGMQKQLDKLVADCRMQGADHEALHKWLTPIFNNVALLKKANDTKEASRRVGEIYNHVNSYPNYFEL